MCPLFGKNRAMDDHRKKLDWARKHLDTLNQSIRVFVDGKPYKSSVKYDPKESAYVARITEVTQLPADWSLMIGDVVHNLRSALDALTYSLAVKNLGREPTEAEAKQIQFAIVDQLKDWPGECGRRLKHLSPNAQAIIQSLQPYHRAEPAQQHVLSGLRDLSNVDKHRHIVTVLAGAISSRFGIEGPGIKPGTFINGYAGRIQKGTVLARWKFSGVPRGVEPKMRVDGELTLDIAFVNPSTVEDGSVRDTLRLMHLCIEKYVFPPLEALL